MSGSYFMDEAQTPEMDWSAGAIPGTTQNADPNAYGVAGSAGIAQGTGTGQHGITTTETTQMGAFQGTWNWLNKPFTTPLSPVQVLELIGVVLVGIIAWNFILYHIRIAAETI